MAEIQDALLRIHRDVDAACRELASRHAARLRCGRGCSSCCIDGITVFEVEADRIRAGAADLLRDGEPHAEGACAFLDAGGACRIYEHRPYVCRTEGLPLRWLEERAPGDVIELRDICPLNDEGGAPLEVLELEDCWCVGPFESRLADLERRRNGGELRRVPLRSLFHERDGPTDHVERWPR